MASVEAQPSVTYDRMESLDRISASRLPAAAGEETPPPVNPSRRKYVKQTTAPEVAMRNQTEHPSQSIPYRR